MNESGKPLLALDSSTSTASVAVGDGARVYAEVLVDQPRTMDRRGRSSTPGHSSALLPTIDHALRAAGLAPGDLGAVVVGAGPGSFTGLRIAAATAKGIVHALGLPMFAYSSLLAMAAQAWASDRVVCALVDARGRDVFAGFYDFEGGVRAVRPPAAMNIDAVLPIVTDHRAMCLGDGAEKHRKELEAVGGLVAPRHFHAPRAAALLWLAHQEPEMGRVASPAGWEPDYLRASGAERIAAKRASGEAS
jgi:tRNA threonylcarbamoyladenosine biosynthesis protein TsaB